MKAAVIGLGKIGLPLAIQIAQHHLMVTGADIDVDLVEKINAGTSPNAAEEGLGLALAEVRRDNSLRATTSTKEAVSDADVIRG